MKTPANPACKISHESFDVVVEIPMNSTPVKYEVDHETGALRVDRFLGTPMFYPANYGFIPNTLGLDGDPVDVLVMTPHSLVHGAHIECRAIGMLMMEDDGGVDPKILALPSGSIWPECAEISSYEEISDSTLHQIEHFFRHYKDLECGKWVKIQGWVGAQEAQNTIAESIKRFNDSRTKT